MLFAGKRERACLSCFMLHEHCFSPAAPRGCPPAPEGMAAARPPPGWRLEPCFLKHVQPSSPGARGNMQEPKCGNNLLATLFLPRSKLRCRSDADPKPKAFRGSQPGQVLPPSSLAPSPQKQPPQALTHWYFFRFSVHGCALTRERPNPLHFGTARIACSYS